MDWFRALAYPSPSIPVLHLCRHAIELTLKSAVVSEGGSVERGHDLTKIWEISCTRIEKAIGEGRAQGIGEFVSFLNDIDPRERVLDTPQMANPTESSLSTSLLGSTKRETLHSIITLL